MSVFMQSSASYIQGNQTESVNGVVSLMVRAGILPMKKESWSQHPPRASNDLEVFIGTEFANEIGIEANMDKIKED